jgi:cytidine deaminase
MAQAPSNGNGAIDRRLIEAASEACLNAYARYSGLRIGAALRTAGNQIFRGANVENAVFPLSQCAEASAIGAMITEGEKSIVEIVIYTESAEVVPPCGGCRQRIAEFATPDVRVHLLNAAGIRRTFTLDYLLPVAFSLRNLP